MTLLEFLKKKVRQFQAKKLKEILDNIKFHQYMKQQAEKRLTNDKSDKIKKEIEFNKKMIEIWQRNELKLRKQMDGLDE